MAVTSSAADADADVAAGPDDGGRRTGSGDGVVAAEVAISEYLGEQVILTLRNGGSVFRALAPPETRAARGEPVRLRYAPRNVMVFSAATEALIA